MKLRSVIALLIMVPLLLFGGLKAYLWYSLKSTMENVQRRFTDTAALHYEDLQTNVLGPIGASGITFTPHGFNNGITIQAVLVDWEKPQDLWPLLQAFWEGKLPENLRFSALNISIPLSGDIATWWDNHKLIDPESSLNIPDSLFGCGTSAFKSSDLKSMGYETISSDIRFEYTFGRRSPYVTFYSRIKNHDMMTVAVEGSIPSNAISLSLNSIYSIPLLANLSISLDDETYNKQKIEYCAKQTGKTPAQFVDDNSEQILTDLSKLHLYPSDEIVDAYRRYLSEPAKITINLNPYEPLGPETMDKIDNKNFIDWLGLEVMIDDSIIKELTEPPVEEVADAEESKPAEQQEEKFRPTPIGDLDIHIGSLTRIKTRDGKTHYANLEKVDEEALTLTQHLVGGSATFTLETREIVEISVLY